MYNNSFYQLLIKVKSLAALAVVWALLYFEIYTETNTLVVRMLDYQSKNPMFKTTRWLAWLTVFHPSKVGRNLGELWLKVNFLHIVTLKPRGGQVNPIHNTLLLLDLSSWAVPVSSGCDWLHILCSMTLC